MELVKAKLGDYYISSYGQTERRKIDVLFEDAPSYEQLYAALAVYEDAEENGLLVRLPCKVGDECWWISGGGTLIHGEVDKIEITGSGINVVAYGHCGTNYFLHDSGIPYFTREAAMKALKGFRENS